MKKFFREYAETFALAFIAALVIRWFIFTPFAITSSGMKPTLQPVDFILSYNLPYGLKLFGHRLGGRSPLLGEVVVFHCPGEPAKACIKRVMGQEGDRIEIKDSRLLHNGRQLTKWAVAVPDFGPLIVPPEHLFVLNDNPHIDTDSRTFGPIPVQDVDGRVAFIWMSLEWMDGAFWPGVRWSRVFSPVH